MHSSDVSNLAPLHCYVWLLAVLQANKGECFKTRCTYIIDDRLPDGMTYLRESPRKFQHGVPRTDSSDDSRDTTNDSTDEYHPWSRGRWHGGEQGWCGRESAKLVLCCLYLGSWYIVCCVARHLTVVVIPTASAEAKRLVTLEQESVGMCSYAFEAWCLPDNSKNRNWLEFNCGGGRAGLEPCHLFGSETPFGGWRPIHDTRKNQHSDP